MDVEAITWIFFLGGLALMVLEALAPGGVAFFLGVGGVLIAALRTLGILTDPFSALFGWLLISTAFVVALRPVLMRYFGGATSSKLANEDFEAMDRVVDVVEPVTAQGDSGRIRFRGATWQARTLEGELPAGSKAVIKYRDNLTWIVEPAQGYTLEYPNEPKSIEETSRQNKRNRNRS